MSQIHIFSGLGSSLIRSFQKGTQLLEDMVDALGPDIDAEHHVWNKWPRVASNIIKLNNENKLDLPVILVGHSNGVLACAKIAQKLELHGIEVAYIGAIDPTAAAFPKIDWNVREVREFWASSGYPKFKRFITGNRMGACVLTDEFRAEHNLHILSKHRNSHIGISKNKKVLDNIRDDIRDILKK